MDAWVGELEGRLECVLRLGRLVTERTEELVAAAATRLPFPCSVVRADIELAALRLGDFGQLATSLAGREPVGGVAVCLPGNAVLSNPLATLAASYLAGNRTLARFPAARSGWGRVVQALIGDGLPGAVTFVERSGAAFVEGALADPTTGVLMIFGSEVWVLPLEDAARRTGTRIVFEGAGKDPFLVLDRTSVPAAAAALARAGCYNAGQACTAPERAYVPADCFDDFVDLTAAHAARLCAGDPADPATDVGPVSRPVAQRLAGQVREAIDRGATAVLSGHSVPVRVGGEDRVLVRPTVLANVDPDCALMDEETFGPVLPICRVSTVDDAVALAERSRYGLSATVFGADDGPARAVAARLARTHGQVFVGETWLEHRRRLPLAPYGGRRLSGWVWEWDRGQFVRRDGPRTPVSEFSLDAGFSLAATREEKRFVDA